MSRTMIVTGAIQAGVGIIATHRQHGRGQDQLADGHHRRDHHFHGNVAGGGPAVSPGGPLTPPFAHGLLVGRASLVALLLQFVALGFVLALKLAAPAFQRPYLVVELAQPLALLAVGLLERLFRRIEIVAAGFRLRLRPGLELDDVAAVFGFRRLFLR